MVRISHPQEHGLFCCSAEFLKLELLGFEDSHSQKGVYILGFHLVKKYESNQQAYILDHQLTVL